MYVCTHLFVCMYACTYTPVYTCVCVCACVFMYICLFICRETHEPTPVNPTLNSRWQYCVKPTLPPVQLRSGVQKHKAHLDYGLTPFVIQISREPRTDSFFICVRCLPPVQLRSGVQKHKAHLDYYGLECDSLLAYLQNKFSVIAESGEGNDVFL